MYLVSKIMYINKLAPLFIVLILIVGCSEEDIVDTHKQAMKIENAIVESDLHTESFEMYPSAIQVNFSISNFMNEPIIFHSIYNQNGQQYDGHDYEFLNNTAFEHEVREPKRTFAQLKLNSPKMNFKVTYNYTVNGELRNAIYGV